MSFNISNSYIHHNYCIFLWFLLSCLCDASVLYLSQNNIITSKESCFEGNLYIATCCQVSFKFSSQSVSQSSNYGSVANILLKINWNCFDESFIWVPEWNSKSKKRYLSYFFLLAPFILVCCVCRTLSMYLCQKILLKLTKKSDILKIREKKLRK